MRETLDYVIGGRSSKRNKVTMLSHDDQQASEVFDWLFPGVTILSPAELWMNALTRECSLRVCFKDETPAGD